MAEHQSIRDLFGLEGIAPKHVRRAFGARVRVRCASCGQEEDRNPSGISGGKIGSLSGLAFCDRECQKAFFRTAVKCSWPGCGQQTRIEGARFRRTQSKSFLCADHTSLMKNSLGQNAIFTVRKMEFLADHPLDHNRLTWNFVKFIIFEKSGGACGGCGAAHDFKANPKTFHIDHRIPRFQGGDTRVSNLQLLCIHCHKTKSKIEQKEVNKIRWQKVVGANARKMSHVEKDKLIERLQSRIAELTAAIATDQNGPLAEPA